MNSLLHSLQTAISLILGRDPDVFSAVSTSLSVAVWSVVYASLFGVPAGMAIGLADFPMKRVVIVLLNTLLALPTVVIGLLVYGFLSRQGPLGGLGILFSPKAIIIGQAILATPIVASYTLSAVRGADIRILPTALTLGATRLQGMLQLVREIRFGVAAAVIAAFGRAISEVGIAMMLGGNIRGYTRTMTTAIALETSKGEFAFGLALGIILMAVALGVNLVLQAVQESRHV
ncbi:MAG TPA: ABC transporter permease [Terriglobales bacterium]|nr:ABC transporter permease [Terriglobales bacterium]